MKIAASHVKVKLGTKNKIGVRRQRGPEPFRVRSFLPKMRDKIPPELLAVRIIRNHWANFVGDIMASKSWPQKIQGRCLIILLAEASPVRLQHMRGSIIENAAIILGQNLISDLHIRQVAHKDLPSSTVLTAPDSLPPLYQDDVLRKKVSVLQNKELRKAFLEWGQLLRQEPQQKIDATVMLDKKSNWRHIFAKS